MTFERPLALALLVAVPIAWWLHRSRSGAPVVRVASLLAFRGAATATASDAPRRAIDAAFASLLAAMTLLAFAAAGPTFGAERAAAFYVVLDRSVSMTARTCDAEQRADALLPEVAPDCGRFVHELANPDGSDGLPESLASHLTAARADGFPGVVLVTDSNLASVPGVAVVGPSAGATANVAIASAVLDGAEAVVAVRNHGAKDVTARVSCADVARDVVVRAGGVGAARFAAPDRGEMATFEVVSPADDLAADDRLVVARRGGAWRVALPKSAGPRLAAAVRAAVPEVVGIPPSDVLVAYGTDVVPAGHEPLLVVAPGALHDTGGARAPIHATEVHGGETVRGDEIVGRGAFADVLPASSATLVARVRLTGGEPMWSDARGVLAAYDGDLFVLAVDPEDPRSDWHREPSFPAFLAAALDRVTDGPDRLVPVHAVAPSESDVVHEPPTTSSPGEIRAVMRPAGAEPDAVRPARWLAAVAAALLAVCAFVPRP